MLEDDAPIWAFAPETLLKALLKVSEAHGERLDQEVDALLKRGDAKALRQPWASSTTASARGDPLPQIHRLRIDLEKELPEVLGKLLQLAQLEQQRRYVDRTKDKAEASLVHLAPDMPTRVAAALRQERKAAMPPRDLFHAALTQARLEGRVTFAGELAALDGYEDGADVNAPLGTGYVLPPADFEKSGRLIPRPYWDAVRLYPFHWPFDRAVAGDDEGWNDAPMPRFASYNQMIARDADFAMWASEARQRFYNLAIHLGLMEQDVLRMDGEEMWEWADRAYAVIARRTGADLPGTDLSQFVDRSYDLLLNRERWTTWSRWIERRWAIEHFLGAEHGYQGTDHVADDDLVHAWLFLLVGRHEADEWLQPAWVREALFDWRTVPLFSAPLPAVRYLVPRTARMSDKSGHCRAE
jgi:hypothetical protein